MTDELKKLGERIDRLEKAVEFIKREIKRLWKFLGGRPGDDDK